MHTAVARAIPAIVLCCATPHAYKQTDTDTDTDRQTDTRTRTHTHTHLPRHICHTFANDASIAFTVALVTSSLLVTVLRRVAVK